MEAEIPDDVLHLICDELRLRQDRSTLFNCAVSSKRLAPLALASLYRAGGHAANEDEELRADVSKDEELRKKPSIYWRSLALASLGKTLYPYQAYLRVLDLRDLADVLEYLSPSIEKVFFQGDLAKFRHIASRNKWNPKDKLNIAKIVDDLGGAIATNANRIEVISGKISSRVLQNWIPRFSRLQRLELTEGDPLGDVNVQQAIYKHCPLFSELVLYIFPSADADEKLGQFISGLPEQSLRYFVAYSRCNISTETCLALNRHGKSLKTLHFSMEADAVPAVALLGGCTALESFQLEASAGINMQESHQEVLHEFANWLAGCEALREVRLNKFNAATVALTPLLFNDNVHLESLFAGAYSQGSSTFKTYHGEDARVFHQALVNQADNLQKLDIRGQIADSHEPTVEDADMLVDSVCKLQHLTTLELHGIMDEAFSENHVIRLLAPLKKLEDVTFAGWGVTDDLLEVLRTMKKLKKVTVNALSRFTVEGLLEFVRMLGPENQEITFEVEWPDHEFALSLQEVDLITSEFKVKLNGVFNYTPPRNPFMGGDDSDADYNGGD